MHNVMRLKTKNNKVKYQIERLGPDDLDLVNSLLDCFGEAFGEFDT